MAPSGMGNNALACVVLAHTDPAHVRRLVAALDPFPVLLHCDARTPEDTFRRMTEGLGSRVVVLPRQRSPWGGWGPVAAELAGYERALAETDASHVAVLSGSDHPLVSTAVIEDVLRRIPGQSIAYTTPMPVADWGLDGGRWRLRFRFVPRGKRMLWLPVPRPLPRGVVLAGGSALKLLAREHVVAVVAAVDRNPDLVRRWRHTWIPDETFVPTLLHTPALVPGWHGSGVRGSAWFIRWEGPRTQSPPWLTEDDLDAVRAELRDPGDGVVTLFARKFSTDRSGALLDAIDDEFRSAGVVPSGWPMTPARG